MSHPEPKLFEQFLRGELARAEEQQLERHVVECEGCAQLLAREARLEAQLAEAAERLDLRPRPVRRWKWLLLPPLATAAALLVTLSIGRRTPPALAPAGVLVASASTGALSGRIDAIVLPELDDRMDDGDGWDLPGEAMNQPRASRGTGGLR